MTDHEEKMIKIKAVADYSKFMSLKASVNEIISVVESERITPGINWRGCGKADLARSFAIREHGFTDNHLTILINKFGQK